MFPPHMYRVQYISISASTKFINPTNFPTPPNKAQNGAQQLNSPTTLTLLIPSRSLPPPPPPPHQTRLPSPSALSTAVSRCSSSPHLLRPSRPSSKSSSQPCTSAIPAACPLRRRKKKHTRPSPPRASTSCWACPGIPLIGRKAGRSWA